MNRRTFTHWKKIQALEKHVFKVTTFHKQNKSDHIKQRLIAFYEEQAKFILMSSL